MTTGLNLCLIEALRGEETYPVALEKSCPALTTSNNVWLSGCEVRRSLLVVVAMTSLLPSPCHGT